jgi:acyl-CoA thioesterase II
MSKSLIDLLSILDIEQLEVNMFRGVSPKTRWQRVFGGQVIGQAMVAACRTVENVEKRLPHSLHCYFILPGDPQIPIIYEVERLRDGRSYSTRRVTAIQHGNAIFSIMVSFHAEEEGSFNHQDKMPDVPPPEKLTAEEVSKQPMFKNMPDFIRRYYDPIGRSNCARWSLAGTSARKSTMDASMSGFARSRNCPKIRRCICVRWPTHRIFRCWMPQWRVTAARCSTIA